MTNPTNGIYVLQGIVPSQIAAAPVSVKVVDLYDDDGQLFSAPQVAQMEAGGGLVLGYFSIGEAENYRSYFSSLPASTLGPVDPSWPGDFQVAYWTPAWKSVAQDYVHQMVTQGYKGAYFDVVDECDTAWAKSHAPGGDSTGAMVTLVQSLASYAHSLDPNFKIWVNVSGSEEILKNASFVNAVDGAFEEELFYKDSGAPQSTADVNYNLGMLKNLVVAGKPVVAIEYVTGASRVASVHAQAAAAGIGSYVAAPNLNLSGVDTEGFATLPTPGPTPTPVPTPTPTPVPTPVPVSGPHVTAVHAGIPGGDLGVGAITTISVGLSKAVNVTGKPQLSLNDGGVATFQSGSGTSTLTFGYTVRAGENASQLAVTAVKLPSGAATTGLDGKPVSIAGDGVVSEPVVVDTSRTRTDVGVGSGQTIHAGSGGDVVSLGGGATVVFRGKDDVAFLGGGSGSVDATIRDHSTGLVVDVLKAGMDKIVGMASDKSAVIHFLGGVGGYSDPQQVMAALTKDGSGGTIVPLGSGLSIDIVGLAPAALHAANFLVG